MRLSCVACGAHVSCMQALEERAAQQQAAQQQAAQQQAAQPQQAVQPPMQPASITVQGPHPQVQRFATNLPGLSHPALPPYPRPSAPSFRPLPPHLWPAALGPLVVANHYDMATALPFLSN